MGLNADHLFICPKLEPWRKQSIISKHHFNSKEVHVHKTRETVGVGTDARLRKRPHHYCTSAFRNRNLYNEVLKPSKRSRGET